MIAREPRVAQRKRARIPGRRLKGGTREIHPAQAPLRRYPGLEGRTYGTRKLTLLVSVRLGVVTFTLPVVAPMGTVAVISDPETTVNAAAAPLKVTPVASVRSVPRIVTAAPTSPEVGTVFTNACRPTAMLKSVPSFGPFSTVVPYTVVPYSVPLVACSSPP